MSSVGTHGRQRKIKKTGRHTAPSQARKVARRAGKAAPAVAVAGALAAVPLVHHFGAAARPAPGHLAAAGQLAPARLTDPGQAAVATGSSMTLKNVVDRLRPHPTISPSNAVRPARTVTRHHAVSVTPTPTPAPSPQPSPVVASPHSALTCSGSSDMLPANYPAIVGFLTTHGYTGLAAAGIAGNIYQESKGNPESVGTGGGGLIGWTPLPAGFVTGEVSADLQTQLEALLTYNQQWAAYIPALNAATSATAAADIYMDDFERPGIPAASNREAAAAAVAAACGL